MKTISMFLSNQVDVLIDSLSEKVFSSLCKRKVVVPNNQLKNYVLLRIAKNSPQKVAMGMEILTLSELVAEHFWIPLELSLRLEHRLSQVQNDADFAQVSEYLQSSKSPLCHFSDQLAKEFIACAIHEREGLKGWRKKLFDEFDFTFECPSGFEWHLLGFNYLPKLYLKAFKEQGAAFYIHSPCLEFWEDLCSDKERMRLNQKLHLKQQESLDEYLQDQNPLLANLGKVGRLFLRDLSDAEGDEFYTSPEDQTVLSKVQSEILTLTPCLEREQDDSIQLQRASSPLQEVELLYCKLQDLLADGVFPHDCVVMAPDINLYAPYIHLVFREKGKIPYSLFNLDLSSESLFVKGFFQLFQIVETGFEPKAIFKLLDNPSFYEKHHFAEKERDQLRKWAEETCVRWGMDVAQRERHLGEKMLEETAAGTWENSFHRLLLGLAMLKGGVPFIEQSQSELLEKWIGLMRQLHEDLQPVLQESGQTASRWLTFFKELARKYFFVAEDEERHLKKVDDLLRATKDLHEPIFTFSSIKRVLDKLWKSSSGSYQASHLHSVHFSSFAEGAPLPKKAIFLLGMQEGVFPRREKTQNLLNVSLEGPSKTDHDRYLFLQLLLSAQEKLVMSYIDVSQKDHEEENPSVVIEELFSYLNRQLPPRKTIPCLHLVRKEPLKPFLPSFFERTVIENANHETTVTTSIKQLEKCAKHPLKFYLQDQVGFFLDWSESQDQEFSVSGPVIGELRKEMLKKPLPEVLCESVAQGKLPLGRFQQSVFMRMAEGGEVFPKGCFSHDLNKTPLEIELGGGRKGVIKGILEGCSEEGFVCFGNKTTSDLLKVWPSYLIFLCLQKEGLSCDLILTKAEKRVSAPSGDPRELLGKYLQYYELCLQYPSPLLPDWGDELLKKTPSALANKMKKSGPFEDEYLEWLSLRDPNPSAETIFSNWSELLRRQFTSFLAWRDT